MPPIFKTPAQYGTSIGQGGPTNTQVLVDIYNSLSAGGALRPNAIAVDLPITAGVSDSVDFSDFAGKIIIGVAGIKSDGTVEAISSATNFALTAANQFDNIYLLGQSIGLITVVSNFNYTPTFTGVGTSATWDTGYFDSVTVVYQDAPNTQNPFGMIIFTTTALETDYTNALLAGANIAFVIYGQGILSPSQYSLSGSTLTIDPGFDVEGGLQLIIITQ